MCRNCRYFNGESSQVLAVFRQEINFHKSKSSILVHFISAFSFAKPKLFHGSVKKRK